MMPLTRKEHEAIAWVRDSPTQHEQDIRLEQLRKRNSELAQIIERIIQEERKSERTGKT